MHEWVSDTWYMSIPTDPKQAEIRTGAALHDASALAAALVFNAPTPVSVESAIQTYAEVFEKVQAFNAEQIALAVIKAGFPGATVENTSGTSNVIPLPVTPQAAPAPIPGATTADDDALWREYFASPSDWYDNRSDKRSPYAPDFAHKTKLGKVSPNGNQYKLGLWIKDAPDWAKAALA